MKYCLGLLPMFVLVGTVLGQVTVVSTSPTNNQTNVPLSTTITITFSTALDTNAIKMQKDFAFTNIQDTTAEPYYSPDATQFKATVQLQANTAYFIAFMYAKAMNGSNLASPYVFYFTTGSSFPALSVSGTVSSGTTGVSPTNGVIGLNRFDINSQSGGDGPDFAMMTKLNSDGTFSIPYVSNGTYWPIAAKDVNGDGMIDPESGTDVIALGDSIVVNNANITGLALTFIKITPYLFSEALPEANTLAAGLPSGSVLKYVQSYEVDTLGRGRSWEFDYHAPAGQLWGIRVSAFENRIEQLNQAWSQWIAQLDTVNNPQNAASSATVIANVEAAGGKAFRTKPGMGAYRFQIQATLGDQSNSRFSYLYSAPSPQYWGVAYTWYNVANDTNWITVEEKGFLCNFSTGAVEFSGSPTGVNDEPATVPKTSSLSQNFPNPFNPTTTIEFSLQERATVKLAVYNLLGEEVAVLVDGAQSAGTHRIIFDARGLPSGMYMYRLISNGGVKAGKMVLVR